jgi:hypothetical protein
MIATIMTCLSCQKTIKIPAPTYTESISIQGIVEPDSMAEVFLFKTVPYFNPLARASELFIRNATLTITSISGTDNLKIDSIFDYVNCEYVPFYKGTIKIVKNQQYNLSITYNGEIYTADATTNTTPVSIDSVGYTKIFKDLYGEHEGVITYFTDTTSKENYYRFQMIRPIDTSLKHASVKITSPCIGADTVIVTEYGRSVYTNSLAGTSQNKIVIEPAYTHRAGIETKVLIQSMDKNMYTFLDAIDRQKLSTYNPFVEPSFLPRGQFGTKANGFFSSVIRSPYAPFTFPE